MPSQDVEFFQSFCRKWINKVVKKHFSDVTGSDDSSLSLGVGRQVVKRVCLHRDSDTMTLTLGRLLVWWVEAKGLFNDVIYGIPSTEFDMSNTYYPQVKLHFVESKYEAALANRRPARGEVSFRWKDFDYSETNIRGLATKIKNDFAKPIFSYNRGKELWSYADKSQGYFFQMKVTSEAEAKKVISQVIGVQDTESPDWEKYLKKHEDKKNYNIQKTIKVMGENIKTPKKRPVAKVSFAYAELFIPGTTKAIILVDMTGTKSRALIYA